MEFISIFRPQLLMQSTSTVLVTGYIPKRIFFGKIACLWKLFYYSPKEAESLKDIQAVLCFPELKIVKPCDTR